MFGLLEEIRSTVSGVESDLLSSGWRKVDEPRGGCILVWEGKTGNSGEMHRHIGFYIGGERAISNNDEKKQPTEHGWTYNGRRKVTAIYWKNFQ